MVVPRTQIHENSECTMKTDTMDTNENVSNVFQFICTHYPTIRELIQAIQEKFDFDLCKSCYAPGHSQTVTLPNNGNVQDFHKMMNRSSTWNLRWHSIHYIDRYFKYKNRGVQIDFDAHDILKQLKNSHLTFHRLKSTRNQELCEDRSCILYEMEILHFHKHSKNCTCYRFREDNHLKTNNRYCKIVHMDDLHFSLYEC